MFGLPSQVQLANYLVGNYRQRVYFLYLQDDFRVNSKLTLNLGLRWEFATPRWERDNVLSNFDPSTNKMITATSGSLYNRTLVNPDYKDLAPRLGLAYSINPKTVFRGGYGISYVHLNRLGSADELGHQRPAGGVRHHQPDPFPRAVAAVRTSSPRRRASRRHSPVPRTSTR